MKKSNSHFKTLVTVNFDYSLGLIPNASLSSFRFSISYCCLLILLRLL